MTLTLAAKLSHGVNSCNPPDLPEGCICLSTCVKNVLFTQHYRFCAFTRALAFFSPKHKSVLGQHRLLHDAFTLACALLTFSNDSAQLVPKQEYGIKGLQTKYFQASA